MVGGCAPPVDDAAVAEEALRGAEQDFDHANDFLGAMGQTCRADGSAINADSPCDGVGASWAPGHGSGTLITPTIVAYSIKYFVDFAGDYLLRQPDHPIAWSLGPDVHDPVSVHTLTGIWEQRRHRMGLWCLHPRSRVLGTSDFVIPPPDDQGTPFPLLPDVESSNCGFQTWALHEQGCQDPLEEDDAPVSSVLFFTLSERVAPDRGNHVRPARPAFRNPAAAVDPLDPGFWVGVNARYYGFGLNDFGSPNWGQRGGANVTLQAFESSGRFVRTPAGEFVATLGGFPTERHDSSGDAGAAWFVDVPSASGGTETQVLQVASHGALFGGSTFLGDARLRDRRIQHSIAPPRRAPRAARGRGLPRDRVCAGRGRDARLTLHFPRRCQHRCRARRSTLGRHRLSPDPAFETASRRPR